MWRARSEDYSALKSCGTSGPFFCGTCSTPFRTPPFLWRKSNRWSPSSSVSVLRDVSWLAQPGSAPHTGTGDESACGRSNTGEGAKIRTPIASSGRPQIKQVARDVLESRGLSRPREELEIRWRKARSLVRAGNCPQESQRIHRGIRHATRAPR